jgi:hypothetical protein
MEPKNDQRGDGSSRPWYWKDEQRAKPRLNCKGVAQIAIPSVEAKIDGTLLDLSVSGCCIEMDTLWPDMKGIRLEVHLTVRGIALRIAGIVRNIRKGRCVGIEFIDVSSRRAEQIEDLFRELDEMQHTHLHLV